MSEKKFEFHFHAPVAQNIANVEHMDVHLDKDGQVQVMNAEKVETHELESSLKEHSTQQQVYAASHLFTKKARTEDKLKEITDTLLQSFTGRKDKARALVEEVRHWQKEGYIDPHFNASFMYEELAKIIPLPFKYDGFRKYYNE